jgi:hypothetical protein
MIASRQLLLRRGRADSTISVRHLKPSIECRFRPKSCIPGPCVESILHHCRHDRMSLSFFPGVWLPHVGRDWNRCPFIPEPQCRFFEIVSKCPSDIIAGRHDRPRSASSFQIKSWLGSTPKTLHHGEWPPRGEPGPRRFRSFANVTRK